MIGIRSITYSLPEEYGYNEIQKLIKASRLWSIKYSFIRTQRLVLTPCKEPECSSKYNELSKICDNSEIRWYNVPIDPLKADKKERLFRFAEKILSNYGRAFVNILAFQDGKTNDEIMELSANLIRKVSTISGNGKDNFRLGQSINIKPDGPFFPFTMSSGNLGFSIALELTQEINVICNKYRKVTLEKLRWLIISELENQIEKIENLALQIAETYNLEFNGFDFSIAPIITENGSIMPILNRLGVHNFGRVGILFATSYLTDLVKSFQKRFKTVGFSGVMYSLLEDFELCMINNEKGISLEELMVLSTMCGCGVDMVPLSGDISNDEMKTIFMEAYAISTRLDKPLGVRILPIPNCKRGQLQYTNLYDDADFIANTKIIKPEVNLIQNIGEDFGYLNRYILKNEQ